jgi:hypothetical protein
LDSAHSFALSHIQVTSTTLHCHHPGTATSAPYVDHDKYFWVLLPFSPFFLDGQRGLEWSIPPILVTLREGRKQLVGKDNSSFSPALRNIWEESVGFTDIL